MTKIPSNLKKQSAYLTVGLWFLRHLWLTTALVALIMLVLGFTVLWYSRSIASQHSFRKEFLVNVAAGFVEISIGTIVAAGLTWVVTQSKFQEIARPVLHLIQSLRLAGTIKKETARNSVVSAVALLSENNVSKSLSLAMASLMGDVLSVRFQLTLNWSDVFTVTCHRLYGMMLSWSQLMKKRDDENQPRDPKYISKSELENPHANRNYPRSNRPWQYGAT